MGKHIAEEQVRSKPALGRTIALALGLCLVVAGAGVFAMSLIEHKPVGQIIMRSVVADPQTVFNKDRILVLLVGKDYDYDQHDYESSKASRSDVIQVYALDFVNHTINEVSIPRDMDVILPSGHEAKINQALSDGGIPEAEAVIAKFLGVPPFDRWIALRINSTKSVIDAIGGIDVPVKDRMDYDDSWGHLHIHFKPGLHHMNGEQAVSYARFRHDWCGDVCRIQRQQQIIHIIATKLKENKLNDFAHLPALIGIVQKNVDTNLSLNELTSLAAGFSNIDPKTIKTAQIPYTDTKDSDIAGNVLVPDDVAKQKIVKNLLLEPPAPTRSPDPLALANVAASSVKVDIKNGTGIPGEARKVADALRAKGFVIADVGNAPSADYATTEIHEHTTLTFAGAKVRAALAAKFKNAPIVSDVLASPPPTTDVTIIVGKDVVSASSAQASLK